jgi:hypothetical protein
MGCEYLSYLLRLWRVMAEGVPAWRVSLQRPGATEQLVFAGMDEMVAFLQAETGDRDGGEAVRTEAPMG